MLSLARALSTAASQNGYAYTLGGGLYLALTDASNARTLLASRGPAFRMPEESGFHPIGMSTEPTALQLADIVDHFYENLEVRGGVEGDSGVTFAGLGEPTLKLDVLLETVRLVHQKRQAIPFRVITNGLQKPDVAAALGSSGVYKASVALMSHKPDQYAHIMQPSNNLTHSDVCAFVEALCAAGVETECTAVRQPGVDIQKAQDLAVALGAQSFRAREYFL